MPATFAELDAVLVPSAAGNGETGCYSALEAMASGVPVVLRDCEGLRVTGGEAALFGRTDAELLDAVRGLDDREARASCGRACRARVERRNDLADHVAAHSAAFRAALPCDVSILLSVWNGSAAHLAACWESIQAQSHRAWELVLVDDGSQDLEVVSLVDQIAEDPRVRLVRLPENRGLAAALNVGLKACHAKLVARMDADDLMHRDRLAKQVGFMRRYPKCDVAGAQIEMFWDLPGRTGPVRNRWTDEAGRTHHQPQVSGDWIRAQAGTGNVWLLNHPAVIMRRDRILALGGYPERYPVAQDLDLWLRCWKAGYLMANMPDVLVRYRVHHGNSSSSQEACRQRQAIVAELLAEMGTY